jgi:hypothetical protein
MVARAISRLRSLHGQHRFESGRLEFRDVVAIITNEATGERILEFEVRGKRGCGLLQKHDLRSHAL